MFKLQLEKFLKENMYRKNMKHLVVNHLKDTYIFQKNVIKSDGFIVL